MGTRIDESAEAHSRILFVLVFAQIGAAALTLGLLATGGVTPLVLTGTAITWVVTVIRVAAFRAFGQRN